MNKFSLLTGILPQIFNGGAGPFMKVLKLPSIDSKTNYKLIQRNVTGKARAKQDDALERALDDATASVFLEVND